MPGVRQRCWSEGDNDGQEGVIDSGLEENADRLDAGADNMVPFTTVTGKRGKRAKKNESAGSTLSQPTTSTIHPVTADTDDHRPTSPPPSTELCVFCARACDTVSCVRCDSCFHYYHLECCGVNDSSDMKAIHTVINILGWSCKACRGDAMRVIQQLRNDLNDLRSGLTLRSEEHTSELQSRP